MSATPVVPNKKRIHADAPKTPASTTLHLNDHTSPHENKNEEKEAKKLRPTVPDVEPPSEHDVAPRFVIASDLLNPESLHYDPEKDEMLIGDVSWGKDILERHCAVAVRCVVTNTLIPFIDKRSPKCHTVITAMRDVHKLICKCEKKAPVEGEPFFETIRDSFRGNVRQFIDILKMRLDRLYKFIIKGYLQDYQDITDMIVLPKCQCPHSFNANRRIVICKSGKSVGLVQTKCARQDENQACGAEWKHLDLRNGPTFSAIMPLEVEERPEHRYRVMVEDRDEVFAGTYDIHPYLGGLNKDEPIPSTQDIPIIEEVN